VGEQSEPTEITNLPPRPRDSPLLRDPPGANRGGLFFALFLRGSALAAGVKLHRRNYRCVIFFRNRSKRPPAGVPAGGSELVRATESPEGARPDGSPSANAFGPRQAPLSSAALFTRLGYPVLEVEPDLAVGLSALLRAVAESSHADRFISRETAATVAQRFRLRATSHRSLYEEQRFRL
jgi:hypothetical protein